MGRGGGQIEIWRNVGGNLKYDLSLRNPQLHFYSTIYGASNWSELVLTSY